MRSVSLSTQLLALFGGVTAAVILTTFLSGQGLFQLADNVATTAEATESEMGRIYSVLDGSSLMQSRVQVILGQKDPDIIEAKLSELEKNQSEIRSALTQCGASCAGIAKSLEELISVNTKTIEMFLAGNLADSYASLATDVSPRVNKLLSEIRQYSKSSSDSIRTRNLSTGEAARFRAFWVLGLSAAIAVSIIVIGTIFRRRLSSRLHATVATIEVIAQGDFDQRLPHIPADELGSVGAAVNTMSERIGSLLRSIEEKNRDLLGLNANLEGLVAERTRAIRTILDHVNIGLFICDRDLKVAEGYSAECNALLLREGQDLSACSLGELLGLNERSRDHFQSLYDQIFDEDFLLGDLSVGQLPNRLTIGDRDLQLIGSVIKDQAGKNEGVLFCLSDITALVSAEKQNARNQSLIMMISNRDGFREFVVDAENLFAGIKRGLASTGKEAGLARSNLHTLKGNAGVYGLKGVADAIHEVEGQASIELADIEGIEKLFVGFLEEHRSILGVEYGKKPEESYSIPLSLVNRVESAWASNVDLPGLREAIQEFFFRIRMKQAATLLGPVEAAMKQLATRLGKQVRFQFRGKETLVPESFAPFFRTLPHLLRNAIDHGLEAPFDRGSKPEEGLINLLVESDDKTWTISVEDDGRGINGDSLVAKAVKLGIIEQSSAEKLSASDKLKLIFHEGLSTADQATDISGRGVGMSAVKQSVESLGGEIRIDSTPQKGTRFVVSLKLQGMLAPAKKVA